MRRISLLVLALAAAHAYAAGSTDKDSLVNTRYKESAASKNAYRIIKNDNGRNGLRLEVLLYPV